MNLDCQPKHTEMKKRDFHIDLIKATAVILVLLCHSSDKIFHLSSIDFHNASVFSFFFTIGRLGVPLFLFSTGALLLNRDYSNVETVISFYKRKLPPLLRITWIWTTVFIIHAIRIGVGFSLYKLIRVYLLIEPCPVSVLWYLPMIIGLYLFIPLIGSALKVADSRVIKLCLSVTIFYQFILNIIPDINANDLAINLWFSGGMFGTYLILGYEIYHRGLLQSIKTPKLILVSVICICLLSLFNGLSLINSSEYSVWYSDSLLLTASCMIFELALRVKRIKAIKAVTFLSINSLGIYVSHMVFLNLSEAFLFWNQVPNYEMQVLIWIAIALAGSSILIIGLNRLSPKFSRFIFNI